MKKTGYFWDKYSKSVNLFLFTEMTIINVCFCRKKKYSFKSWIPRIIKINERIGFRRIGNTEIGISVQKLYGEGLWSENKKDDLGNPFDLV